MGVERTFAAEHGRGWLDLEEEAKKALLTPHGHQGFRVVDFHLCWQLLGAFLIIYGNLTAGFLISYFTPTVGLGCRSGGYMIFGILTLTAGLGEFSMEVFSSRNSWLRSLGHISLTSLEFVNVCWLIWITLAQTFGFYQTCKCQAKVWGGGGGYIPFDLHRDTSFEIVVTWSLGTALASLILVGSLIYIVQQWCEQSHLMTSDYKSAIRGLMWTRRVKRVRYRLLCAPRMVSRGVIQLVAFVGLARRQSKKRLSWTPERTKRGDVRSHMPGGSHVRRPQSNY